MNKKLTSTDKYSFFTSFFSKKYQIQGGGLLADLQVFILISLIITHSKPLNQVKNNKLKQDEIFPPLSRETQFVCLELKDLVERRWEEPSLIFRRYGEIL